MGDRNILETFFKMLVTGVEMGVQLLGQPAIAL